MRFKPAGEINGNHNVTRPLSSSGTTSSQGVTQQVKKTFNPEYSGSIYNAWAASLTSGATLNSGKLITIDWASWQQQQQDDVYLHTYFASRSLIPPLLGIAPLPIISRLDFAPHISSAFNPGIHHRRFCVHPQHCFAGCVGTSMRKKSAKGDGKASLTGLSSTAL